MLTTTVVGATVFVPRTTLSITLASPTAKTGIASAKLKGELLVFRLFILVMIFSATAGFANEPPPVPKGGLVTLHATTCLDNETGERGTCYLMQDQEGITYVTFWQDEVLMFIRQLVGDGYTVIWVRDTYAGI